MGMLEYWDLFLAPLLKWCLIAKKYEGQAEKKIFKEFEVINRLTDNKTVWYASWHLC